MKRGKLTFLEADTDFTSEYVFEELLSEIDIEWSLMAIPTTSLQLPIKFLPLVQTRRKVRIEYRDFIFEGFIVGKSTDKRAETVSFDLEHVISTLNQYKMPTNLSIKDTSFRDTLDSFNFLYAEFITTTDEYTSNINVDYVFSNQTVLEAYSQLCWNTDDVYWRVNRQEPYLIEFGVFGEEKDLIISKKTNLISDPVIDESFGDEVINYAVVLTDKSEAGVSSTTLQQIYENPDLQDPNFPVVLTGELVNNERRYDYIRIPQFAPNMDAEYAIMDLDGIALAEGAICHGYFSSNDLQPHANYESLDDTEGEGIINADGTAESIFIAEARKIDRLSNTAIAAIMGNIDVESGFQPMRLEGTASGVETNFLTALHQSRGWGLIQWTPPSKIQGYPDHGRINTIESQVPIIFAGFSGDASVSGWTDSFSVDPMTVKRYINAGIISSDKDIADFTALNGNFDAFKSGWVNGNSFNLTVATLAFMAYGLRPDFTASINSFGPRLEKARTSFQQAMGNEGGNINANTPISNEDRLEVAKVMYDRAKRQLRHSRPKTQYDLSTIPNNDGVNVADKIRFDYDNTIVEYNPCGNYYHEIMMLDDLFYVYKIIDRTDQVEYVVTKDLYAERTII